MGREQRENVVCKRPCVLSFSLIRGKDYSLSAQAQSLLNSPLYSSRGSPLFSQVHSSAGAGCCSGASSRACLGRTLLPRLHLPPLARLSPPSHDRTSLFCSVPLCNRAKPRDISTISSISSPIRANPTHNKLRPGTGASGSLGLEQARAAAPFEVPVRIFFFQNQ